MLHTPSRDHPGPTGQPHPGPQAAGAVSYTLALSCADRSGLVAAIANAIHGLSGDIRAANQFEDRDSATFFMRIVFETASGHDAVSAAIAALARGTDMRWSLRPTNARQRVLLLVSKFDHCLNDLLYRTHIGELNMDVVGIVSNHPRTSLRVAGIDGIPFHHLPVGQDNKGSQEARIRRIIEETGTELVVLARYMQILSDEMAAWLSGRCINIHHSFLPSFKGAKPYHQAHRRGVKMIGATAHYVTADLDEGPIIHQSVEPVSHVDTAEDLVRKGRNIEQRVLSHAVMCHLQQRVFMNGDRTVVFGV